jgi:hypothetical protein
MYEQILLWIGLGALLILCLPIPLVQRAEPLAEPVVAEPMPVGLPILRPVERRRAAAAMTSAASRPTTPAR